jgi:hypothetical protein
VTVSTAVLTGGCSLCHEKWKDWESLEERVNHYLKHGYKLLHVGQETSRANEGLYHATVAVLGR